MAVQRFAVTIALLGVLTGCQRSSDSPATGPVVAASVTPATNSDTPEALMRVAFPDWPQPGFMISVPAEDGQSTQLILPTPRLVLAPEADHRLLIVQGTPAIEGGTPSVSPHQHANLGLYAFALQQGRWVKTNEIPSFAWSGSWGEVSDLMPIHLVPKVGTILVKEVSCGSPGTCEVRTDIFLLETQGVRTILEERTSANSDGWTGPCDRVIEDARAAAAAPKPFQGYLPSSCWATDSTLNYEWRAPEQWPDIVLSFKGLRLRVDRESFEVHTESHDGEYRLRYDGHRYRALSGRNPLAE